MFELHRVRAISLDLDDTLWPIWPTIERAERALQSWLAERAPMTAALFASPAAVREIREQVALAEPALRSDLSALRRESIRFALIRAGDDASLTDGAFDVFFTERQRVSFYDDARPALERMSARYPMVSLTNGNADLERVGIARHFRAAVSAREFGVGKPDPRIFHAAAGALDLRPEDVLHVGDDATMDGLGALNAGMQCAWVNRGDSLWPHEPQPHLVVRDLDELCAALELTTL